MTELTEFKHVNNSPTTVLQQKLVSKLASYFGIPNKLMKAGLDLESAKDRAVVRFSMPDNPLRDEFYIASLKLNVNELINPKKLFNSKLYTEYTIMLSKEETREAVFVAYDSSFRVLYDASRITFGQQGGGGIYMNYYPDFEDKILLPIDTFLKLRYPSPL